MKETPARLSATLVTLARGHALLHGRKRVTGLDLGLAAHVGLCSMPRDRRIYLRALLAGGNGVLSDQKAQRALNTNPRSIQKIKETLELLGVIMTAREGARLAPDFKELRDPSFAGACRKFASGC